MTANDVMKIGDVTKNFNEKLRIYLSYKELNGLFNSVSNLIHADIPLLLF